MLTGIDINLGKYSILLGSLVLLGIFIDVLKLQFTLFLSVMTLGSIFWIIGNILWVIGYPVFDLVIWWQAFLLFTITGERLELARMVNISELSKKIFVLCSSIVLAGLVMSLFLQDLGIRLFSLGIIALTIWLTKNDIARRTVKSKSLTRFIAVSLLSSYFWLGVTGLIGVFFGASIIGTLKYDAFLHAFFLGFTFSMIFGHAPIIFPAILKIQMKYSARFYLHLALLHISVMIRVFSDITNNHDILKISGMLNAITILVFLLNTVSSIKRTNNDFIKQI